MLEQHRHRDVLDVRLDVVHVTFRRVDLSATDQPLLRPLAIAVLQEDRQQRQRIEMHPLPRAQCTGGQAVDRAVQLAERPALIDVFAWT